MGMEDQNRWQESNAIRKVGTDGGCTTRGVVKASYGVVDDAGRIIYAEPVLGNRQTAQRGEVNAIAAAVAQTDCTMHVVTDSQYVAKTIEELWDTPDRPWMKHGDLWGFIWERIKRIAGVTWVKAHLTWDEAEQKGIREDDWMLNQADRKSVV